ncbi:MAG: tetratricopeptide repeat protein [Syntrophobacteraceae bacterium]
MDPVSRDRRVIVLACLGIVLALSGCTWVGRQSSEVARLRGGLEKAPKEAAEGQAMETFAPAEALSRLPVACGRAEADAWADQAEASPEAGFRAAGCYLVLARDGAEQRVRLADAKKGRLLAERLVKADSQNGFAHYLLAYLTGLVAENNSAQGLRLVGIIEREALEAANLDPKVDQGGPDRLLGELYLRAPSFPMSVGDFSKAIFHFRRAVTLAPGHVENRLGLVETLLAEDEKQEACGELREALSTLVVPDGPKSSREKALKLMESLCAKLN